MNLSVIFLETIRYCLRGKHSSLKNALKGCLGIKEYFSCVLQKVGLKNLMKPNNYRKNSFFRNIKSSEVKHSSNLQKKSNEMSLVVVSELDFRHKKI